MSTSTLAAKAAAKAAEVTAPAAGQEGADWPPAVAPGTGTAPAPYVEAPTLSMPDMGEYEPGDGDPEMIPVHIAWLRVRRDVRAIAKREVYNGGGTRYNFRGIDTVLNVFGPITLRHGVLVVPVKVEAQHRDTTTSKGNATRECTVTVTWDVIGPKGDKLTMQTCGEALDTSDKGTAKAQSVALRVLLLTGGLTPTTDVDPDSLHMDRGEMRRTAASYRDEALSPGTSKGRLLQMHHELKMANRLGETVENEEGNSEPIGALIVRTGQTRYPAS
ncbi:ERF family protein [Streptosporangium saharense]|uniref:ERF family protein n=1 Tax=Streptosporangium saharense TaxID=1706840 RepID=UPI0036B5301A